MKIKFLPGQGRVTGRGEPGTEAEPLELPRVGPATGAERRHRSLVATGHGRRHRRRQGVKWVRYTLAAP